MEKAREIRKMLKQYGAGIQPAHLGGAVNIYPPDCFKNFKKYQDKNDINNVMTYVTLEKSIEIVKETKVYYYDCPVCLPTALVDYLESEVGKYKTDILERDIIKF